MKKKLLIISMLTLVSNLNAQTKFGAKAGLNISNLTGDYESTDAKDGFYLGGFANLKISKKFAFQPELLFSTQGGQNSVSYNISELGTISADAKYRLNYINVPLMFKYYIINGFNIEAGPQIGFLVDSNIKINSEINSELIPYNEGFDIKQNANELFKTVDFGLNVGLNYKFINNFDAGIRYNFSLSNISKIKYGNIYNSVLSIGVGYTF